jgi:hypothetical protein
MNKIDKTTFLNLSTGDIIRLTTEEGVEYCVVLDKSNFTIMSGQIVQPKQETGLLVFSYTNRVQKSISYNETVELLFCPPAI